MRFCAYQPPFLAQRSMTWMTNQHPIFLAIPWSDLPASSSAPCTSVGFLGKIQALQCTILVKARRSLPGCIQPGSAASQWVPRKGRTASLGIFSAGRRRSHWWAGIHNPLGQHVLSIVWELPSAPGPLGALLWHRECTATPQDSPAKTDETTVDEWTGIFKMAFVPDQNKDSTVRTWKWVLE